MQAARNASGPLPSILVEVLRVARVDQDAFKADLDVGMATRSKYLSHAALNPNVGDFAAQRLPRMTVTRVGSRYNARIRLTPQVVVECLDGKTRIEIDGTNLPETLMAGAVGRRLSEVIDHPALRQMDALIVRCETDKDRLNIWLAS